MTDTGEREDRCWRTIGVWGSRTPRCDRLVEVTHCRNCDVFRSAGREMGSRPIPADYRREWTERLAEAASIEPERPVSAVVFRIGTRRLLMPVALLHEVLEMLPIRELPHRRGSIVRGLVAHRGRLVVCVSLGQLLRITDLDSEVEENTRSPRRLLVVGRGSALLAFPVTEVVGIVRYGVAELAELPAAPDGERDALVTAVLDFRGTSVGCLDGERVISALERSLSR